MRFVLSAMIALLWTLQAQTQELDSPDLLATANIPYAKRVEAKAATQTQPADQDERSEVSQVEQMKTETAQANTQVAQAPIAKKPTPLPTPNTQPAQPAAQPTPTATPPAQAPKPVPAVNVGPQVNSKVTLEDFTWGADARYRIQLYLDGKGLQFRGDLRANTRTEFTKDRLTIGLRHFPQDFLIITVSVDNDEYAHVFLVEASGSPFRILNSRSIRARKAGVMDEMEGMIAAFKKVSGFDLAQSMRKMAEYFGQNPNKKAHDLFDSLEREEAFVKVLAKPKSAGGASDQGIVSPEMPPKVAQSPAQTKKPGEAMDLRPTTAPPSPDDDFQDPQQQAWLKQQRARLKAERERQQQQRNSGYDPYGRPVYNNQQGGMVYDPSTGGYYRRQYQTPGPGGYPQGYPQQQQQQQPGYYRSNPFY